MDFDPNGLLSAWKDRVLRPSDVSYESAVGSLFSPAPLVEVRQQAPSRWTFYRSNTDDVAVFSHCCVFSMSDNYESGNLVPKGAIPPEGMLDDRVERSANYRCNYGYAFDTFHDRSLYTLQQSLEEYMLSVEGFNPDGLPRRDYQSGQDPVQSRRYWMRTPMFLQVARGEPKPQTPASLHKWVAQAARQSSLYYANPARPKVMALEDGTLRDISKCVPPLLYRGDIVMVTFTVSLVVSGKLWNTQLLPIEIVRVGEMPVSEASDPGRYAVPVVDTGSRPLLADGESVDGPSRTVSATERSSALHPPQPVASGSSGTDTLDRGVSYGTPRERSLVQSSRASPSVRSPAKDTSSTAANTEADLRTASHPGRERYEPAVSSRRVRSTQTGVRGGAEITTRNEPEDSRRQYNPMQEDDIVRPASAPAAKSSRMQAIEEGLAAGMRDLQAQRSRDAEMDDADGRRVISETSTLSSQTSSHPQPSEIGPSTGNQPESHSPSPRPPTKRKRVSADVPDQLLQASGNASDRDGEDNTVPVQARRLRRQPEKARR